LPFLLLGTAGVNAQVRIGGNTEPNQAAVLDLNASDSGNGTKALALPRVNLGALTGNDANLDGKTPLSGMLVYNTNTALGTGVYYWDGTTWFKVSTGSLAGADGIVGNEITNVTDGGGLEKTGDGTVSSPYSVGITTGGVTATHIQDGTVATADLAANAVTSAKIAAGAVATADLAEDAVTSAKILNGEVSSADIKDATIATADLANGAVTAAKLNAMGASAGHVLTYSGSAWAPKAAAGSVGTPGGGNFVVLSRSSSFQLTSGIIYFPLACYNAEGAAGLFRPITNAGSNAGTASMSTSSGTLCQASAACTCVFQTF
jgi:hypothetical protein